MNFVLLTTIACAVFGGEPAGDEGQAWPQWRGPATASVAANADLPVEFGPDRNVAWSAPLPGGGYSAPVVVGERVFVTANGQPDRGSLHVLCFDRGTGERRWERTFEATGRTAVYEPDMRVATPTPAADGERVFVLFSSNDLACFTLEGVPVWYRGLTVEYPNLSNSLGMSSSLLLAGGTLVAQCEADSESYVFGLDPATGATRWRRDRPRKANWNSPTLLPTGPTELVLLSGSEGAEAVEPADGVTAWEWEGSSSTVVSPTVSGEFILLPSDGVTALRLEGGVPQPAWDARKLSPSYASPVVVGDVVATVNQGGILSAADLNTGDMLWQARLPGGYWATPVAAGDRLYLPTREGGVTVVRVKREEAELLAENALDPDGSGFRASPAVAGDALFLRSDATLWKIAAE